MSDRRQRLELIGTLLGFAVAGYGAWSMRGHLRAVDILTLFGGGFGAGASFVALVAKRRAARPSPNG